MPAAIFRCAFILFACLGTFSTHASDTEATLNTKLMPPFVFKLPIVSVDNASNDWSGVYVGGFGGYTAGDFDTSQSRVGADGYEIGVFAGYDHVIDGYIIGGEADITLGSVGGVDNSSTTNLEKRINGSLRARAGLVFNQVLIFGTAGLAVTGTEAAINDEADTATHLGWTVGAGVDMKITERLFGRLEYRYTDYDSKTFSIGSTAVSSGLDEHSLRAGLGIRF